MASMRGLGGAGRVCGGDWGAREVCRGTEGAGGIFMGDLGGKGPQEGLGRGQVGSAGACCGPGEIGGLYPTPWD